MKDKCSFIFGLLDHMNSKMKRKKIKAGKCGYVGVGCTQGSIDKSHFILAYNSIAENSY